MDWIELAKVRYEVTRKRRKLHNEELNDLCCSPKIVRAIKSRRRMGGACSTYGERRGVYRVLLGKPEGKRSLERPRRRWEDNIRIYYTFYLSISDLDSFFKGIYFI
jgi:hypothetical protein